MPFGDVARAWSEKGVPRLAAALAFYSLFSLAPLVVVAVQLAGYVFGRERAAGELGHVAGGLAGGPAAQTIEHVLAAGGSGTGTALGLVMLVFGASLVFAELKHALNVLWDLRETGGWRETLGERLAGMVLVLAAAIALAALVLFDGVVAGLGRELAAVLPGGVWVYRVVDHLALFAVVTVGAAVVYKAVPDVRVGWRAVLPGGLLAGALLVALKLGCGLYLGASRFATLYGTASSLAVMLVWIYLSVQALLLGALVTRQQARARGEGQPVARADVRIERLVRAGAHPGPRER